MDENERLRQLKDIVMAKPRKVIVDNDGGDVAQLCRGTQAKDLVETRVKPALDAGIDTYIYTTGWGFGIGLHDSKIGSVLRTKQGHLSRSLVDEFTRDGNDALRINSEYVKRSGKEFLWGMRMNDTHDAGYDNVFMPENRFKTENPDVMFGTGIHHGAVTGVDYLDPRVTDFAIEYIMDVMDRYSVDGIFLDFFRHPIFFRSNTVGNDASDSERDAMTEFMIRITEETNKRRIDREVYYLVAIRVPDSVEYCNAIGIDIEKWLEDGLVDILSTTSYLHLNEWNYSAELGHRFGVPVYPSLDESRVKNESAKDHRNSLPGYYGRIMNVWTSDCDGVLMFNDSGLKDTTSRDVVHALEATVKGREYVSNISKSYFVSVRGVGSVAGGALPHEEYIRIPTLNHHSPITILKGKVTGVPIDISEQPESVAKKPTATVRLCLLGDPDSIAVYLNNRRLEISVESESLDRRRHECAIISNLPLDALISGRNIFRFESERNADLLDLRVDLEY